MLTEKTGLLEAMIEVYTMEKGTREFYERAAGAAYEEVTRRAFRELARWEGEHMGYIQYLYQAITEDRELMSFEEFKEKVRPEALEGGIPAGQTEKWLEEYTFIDELGALIVALKMEARSFAFYDEVGKKSKDPAVKALMDELKRREEGHIKYLKDLRMKLGETP
ncbi:MAG: ferritin family protein [Nitrospiraceae bacterium]|nr:ferritin family protein [Nitrospiraceae bacterium]